MRPTPPRASSTASGRIVKLVNNYSQISFNFGPTLLTWLESKAPEIYARDPRGRPAKPGTILRPRLGHRPGLQPRDHAAGQQPRQGHAGPLGHARFRASLRAAAGRNVAAGNRRRSARRLELLGAAWHPFHRSSRRIRPRARGASASSAVARRQRRRSIDPDPGLSSSAAVGPIASRYSSMTARSPARSRSRDCCPTASSFADRLTRRFFRRSTIGRNSCTSPPTAKPTATTTATATWRSPTRWNTSKRASLARLTNYGEYLEKHPPTHEVEIVENTAWSCAHGIESLAERLRLQLRRASGLESGVARSAARGPRLAARQVAPSFGA